MGVKGQQSISYIYSRRAKLLSAGLPRLVELVQWQSVCLRCERSGVRFPALAVSAFDHFRNVQHHKDLHLVHHASRARGAHAARPRGFDSLPSLLDVRTLILFFEIKLLRARGSDPELISRNVQTQFQMFINFRNVVILLVILYILIFILVFVTHVHTTHSHPIHANTETVRTSTRRYQYLRGASFVAIHRI